MFASVLIIDKRKELSIKYKRLLEEKDVDVTISGNLTTALKFIQEQEPDLILISDSIDEDLSTFCARARILTYNMRPIIIALSKSSDINDRIKILENGADDFISEPINNEEFKTRIKAHLRREIETTTDIKTKLPNKGYCQRAIKRTFHSENPWSCILLKIEHFDEYKENYSEFAATKLTQTLCAIANSVLDKSNFLGMLEENKFLIISSPYKAEKIAEFLTFAFDSVRPKFYSREDFARGYTIQSDDKTEERKTNLLSLNIAVVSNDFVINHSCENILQMLESTCSMIKDNSKSNFLICRPKITSTKVEQKREFNNKIVLLEQDEALSYLLSINLSLEGYTVELKEDIEWLGEINPALVILDTGDLENETNLKWCSKIKEVSEKIKILVTSSHQHKELVLNAGADFYLPKPYNINTLSKWVKTLIKEVND